MKNLQVKSEENKKSYDKETKTVEKHKRRREAKEKKKKKETGKTK